MVWRLIFRKTKTLLKQTLVRILYEPIFNRDALKLNMRKEEMMDLILKGQVLKLDVVDKCNRKFALDCEIIFPEKIPVTYNFNPDEIIGHGNIYKIKDGLNCEVSLLYQGQDPSRRPYHGY